MRTARWALAAVVVLATGYGAGLAWDFIAHAAHRRNDWYLVGIAYFAAAWVGLCGLGVVGSIFSSRKEAGCAR